MPLKNLADWANTSNVNCMIAASCGSSEKPEKNLGPVVHLAEPRTRPKRSLPLAELVNSGKLPGMAGQCAIQRPSGKMRCQV